MVHLFKTSIVNFSLLIAFLGIGVMAVGGSEGQARADVSATPTQSAVVRAAGPPTLRRLSESQYKNTIAQIFGADITVPGRFEPPVREDGLLAIGQSHVIVTPAGFEQYALRAQQISAQVLDEKHRDRYLQCGDMGQEAFDATCASRFLSKYGLYILRRPLSEKELATAMALSRRATASTGSFSRGVGAGLMALLSSPAFIFRIETTEPDPDLPGAERLDAYSLAARISFLLWNSAPDEKLLNAASDGSLMRKSGLENQVKRMMASPRLEQGVRAFFSDMLAYDQFAGLSKDPELFPIFNPQLRDDAQEQSLRTIVDHLLVREGDYRDLFTTKNTFLTRSLGALYSVPVDHRSFGGWMPYTFPDDAPHAGLLTFPAFLMLDPSHEGRSSPTIRGMVVRQNFMCEPVPLPPANVNFNIVQDVNDPIRKTARERLSAHQESPACAGCHKITDPIGLALENYTPVGKYRATENGVLIDASGEVEGKTYNNAIELTKILRNSPSVSSCVVQRTLEYGVGRRLTLSEEGWLEQLYERFEKDGFKYPSLLWDVATSPAFRAVETKPSSVAAR